ncbi:acyltransferase [Gelidibacter maritimus]|uniref:Acyltransferase n=1 Tax=Gelidibacter maritimus TaxID=2761487 RepID=A0A7W2M657_9FLAO|nr:acyltransferase [Gelidibacter maritimus]MBA6153393.1 acyltransferase [Gelidibacter maritimus]
MSIFFRNVISVLYSLLRFSILKIIHGKRFYFDGIQRFSPQTQLLFINKGEINLGHKVRAHSLVKFRSINSAQLIVDDNVSFNYGCIVTARRLIHIHKGVEFGPNVLLYDHDHDFRVEGGLKANKYKDGEIIIGENSWIGAGTIILKNTYIGKNCVIGAGCVISGSYPDNSLIIQKRETTIKVI